MIETNENFVWPLEIKSVIQFLEHLPSIQGDSIEGYRMIYRGQSADLPLLPKLLRNIPTTTLDGLHHIGLSSDQLFSLKRREEVFYEEFRRQAIPFLGNTTEPTSILEWLAIAQHHGLATRLLDWSENPLTALFFAVSNISDHSENEPGVVWTASVQTIQKELNSLEEIDDCIQDLNEVFLYRPRHLIPRVVAQQGCFTVHPVNATQLRSIQQRTEAGSGKLLLRPGLFIPAYCKRNILRELDRLGINHLSLFPDLDGLSNKLNTQDYLKRFS